MNNVWVPADIFEHELFADEPLTERTAYLWVAMKGPVRFNAKWLERQWKWKKGRALPFIRKMLGGGLFMQDGDFLTAISIDEAQRHPELIEGDSWRSIRLRVFVRDGFRCVYCGSSGPLHCDHVIPKSKGGLDVESNLATACAPCNLSKGARVLDEWMPQ